MIGTLEEIVDKYLLDLESVARQSAAVLANRVVTRTPVLSGSLQSSWTASLNQPRTHNVTITSANASPVRSDISSEINKMISGDEFYFSNGQPYAARIEYEGWSAKRPEGMLRVPVAEWSAIVSEAVRRYGQ